MGQRGSVHSLHQGHTRPDHVPDTHFGVRWYCFAECNRIKANCDLLSLRLCASAFVSRFWLIAVMPYRALMSLTEWVLSVNTASFPLPLVFSKTQAAAGPEQRSSVPLRSVYRRNSISEAPTGAVAIMPHEQALLAVMKDDTNQPRHERTTTGQTGSTPPFSYCENISTARPVEANVDGSPFDLDQPLVSFSPPFDASPLSPGGHRQLPRPEDGVGHVSSMRTVHGQSGTEVTCRGARTSLALAASCSPALLETLPKSPFSSAPGTRTSLQPSALADATGTNARFSTSLALPMLERPLISAPGQNDRKFATATQAVEVTEVRRPGSATLIISNGFA